MSETNHKCENFMENNACKKCRKPIWAVIDKDPFNIGDKVTPTWRYNFHGRPFEISFKLENGDYQLIFLSGKEKGTTIERFAWWELEKYIPVGRPAGEKKR